MKQCKGCLKDLPVDEFYRHKAYKDGRLSKCKRCVNGEQSKRYHANPALRAKKAAGEKARLAKNPRVVAPEEHLRQRLWALYRLTVDQYERMLAQQGGRCAVCKTDDPGKNSWHVDHDHACCDSKKSCGKCVRAILCGRCNVGLGMFRDDADILRAALDYLSTQAAMQALGAIA